MSSENSEIEKISDSVNSFLASHRPPANFEKAKADLREFISQYVNGNKRIVLITSGGTTAPIEAQTVRFLDNFSLGRRGAASAEYFLKEDYGVIFLHREGSLYPYTRHFSLDSVLQVFQIQNHSISVDPNESPVLLEILEQREKYRPHLLSISFVTISDYLYLLQECIVQLSCLKRNALLYLAAAASDFYIPPHLQAANKLHSDGKLILEFYPVPKMLRLVKTDWAKEAYMVTFKLETDPDQLISRARRALTQYHHELVIGNLLPTRHEQIYFVNSTQLKEFTLASEDHGDLESKFIRELVRLHEEAIRGS